MAEKSLKSAVGMGHVAFIVSATASIWLRIRQRRRQASKGTRPRLNHQQAELILCRFFGFQQGHVSIEPLDSYDDLNFRVKTDSETFVLKVFSSRRGSAEMVVMENKAIMHIHQRSEGRVLVPQVIIPSGGKACGRWFKDGVVEWDAGGGVKYYVRLLTFLPGTLLGELPRTTDALLRHLGQTLGSMDRALADFDHHAAHRAWEWDLTQVVAEGRLYLGYIKDGDERALAASALSDYEAHVTPLHPQLRWRVIHNDANDYNVCVDPTATHVAGIFDFGDMVHSPLVHNVAIAAAYACLKKEEPMSAAAAVVAGYHAVHPLQPLELRAMYPCIRARLAQSVCKSAYSRSLEPDNEYLGVTEKDAWVLLRQLSSVTPEAAFSTFCCACGELAGAPAAQVHAC